MRPEDMDFYDWELYYRICDYIVQALKYTLTSKEYADRQIRGRAMTDLMRERNEF